MRIPARAPSTSESIAALLRTAEALTKALEAVSGPTYRGRYIHWDKLRRLDAPAGLTAQQWWAALKIRRQPLARDLPLSDSRGRQFTVAIPDPAQELLHRIDRDAAGQVLVTDTVGGPQNRDRYVIQSLIEESITSSQIEGAATTRLVAKEMLLTGRRPRNRDESMIANNYAAMQQIHELKDRPLSREIILDLQRTLTHNAIDQADAAGRLRRDDEQVHIADDYGTILHIPPDARELDARIDELCAFANGETPSAFLHPVVRSILLHFALAYVHPFVDGNGRCARALFYWSMLRHGYWLCEFISISHIIKRAVTKYGRAYLHTETDDNDATYFLLYHLDIVRRAIDEVKEHLRRQMQQVSEVEALLQNSVNLNHRQLDLLSHALRHVGESYTIAQHRASHGVVYQTARTDLLDLSARGLLEQRKRGKEIIFLAPMNLHERIRNLQD